MSMYGEDYVVKPKGGLSTRLTILDDWLCVHDCGQYNRSITIRKSSPRRIQIGCTSYTRKEAIKQITKNYPSGTMRWDYIAAVELAFDSVPLSWKLSKRGLPKIKFGKDLAVVFHVLMITSTFVVAFSASLFALSNNNTVAELFAEPSFMITLYVVVPYVIYHLGKFLKK